MATLSEPTAPTTRLPAWRLAMLASSALMAPALLVIQSLRGQPIDVAVIAGGSAVLFLLTWPASAGWRAS